MTTLAGQPCTDDFGVIEQLRRIYSTPGKPDRETVSIDVGAFIGVISLAMSRFGPKNHTVHSFEADDLNFSRLVRNTSKAKYGPIAAHNMAVADYVGTSEFRSYNDPGDNHLGTDRNTADSLSLVGVQNVPVTTLNVFADQTGFEEINVLKIDVEGFELDVLLGAKDLLANKQIRAMIIETPLDAAGRIEMNEFLADHGFSTAYIVRNSTELTPVSEAEYTRQPRTPLNMLAVQPELAHQMGVGE